MQSSNNIQYLRSQQIDRELWDNCIDQADNGLIYAYSFYLDTMCDQWDALILENYKAIMPLPWRSKWGIKYVYQPAFIQRLGVFGKELNEEILNQFIVEAMKKFKFIHYNVSSLIIHPHAKTQEQKNFIINLNKDYSELRNAYSNECIRNIHKAEKRGCIYSTQFSSREVVELYQTIYGHFNNNINSDDYNKLILLIDKALQLGKVDIAGVKDEKDNTLLGAAILKDHKRLYYLIGAPTPSGREARATYYFINELLKRNGSSNLLFDFEGSDIPNVAAFYRRFSPQTEYYYELKINTLPRAFKWLKA